MSTFESAKKSQKDSDWHRADIVAALHKQGWSLRRLSLHYGYKSAGALKNALDRPWPKGQQIIAEAIGIAPESIWPTRYHKAFSGEWN
ncbi:helix-turn-helix domain-containing protein [Enterobacter roggenkampii]|nr:helix-turn-helix domain-containing protein [Enterobacter roggenkampii]